MKITNEDVMSIINVITQVQENINLIKSVSDAARPLLKESVNLLSENLAEFKPMIERLSEFTVMNRIDCINLYKDNGFTQQEAILLSMADAVALKESVKNYTNSIKK